MYKSNFVFCSVVLIVLGISSAVYANQITNPGFEMGNFSDWTIAGNSGWFGVGTDGQLIPDTYPSFGDTFINVYSGNYAGFASVAGAASPLEFISLSQTVSVSSSTLYDIGYFVGVDSPGTCCYGFPGIMGTNTILVDGNPISLSGLGQLNPGTGTGSSPGDMRHVFGEFLTDSTQTIATVTFTISGSGMGRAGFSFDDFHFNPSVAPVPEPATFTLLGIGFVGLGLFHRRNSKIQKQGKSMD